MAMPPSLRFLILLLLLADRGGATAAAFELEEATIDSIHRAFAAGELTSRGLVELYLRRIASLEPALHAVIELDPDGALASADRADAAARFGSNALPQLHGIPVLLKDNIAAAGPLNATAGSLAMVGSRPARDAGVVERLRNAGAVLLGTTSLSEWCNFRGPGVPAGWSPRGGQGKVRPLSLPHFSVPWKLQWQIGFIATPRTKCRNAMAINFGMPMQNPYVPSATPCSSSSGSAIAAAANMAAITIGTETDGSIMCPSSYNSVVGIKPTVGLTSRAGVIIVSWTQLGE